MVRALLPRGSQVSFVLVVSLVSRNCKPISLINDLNSIPEQQVTIDVCTRKTKMMLFLNYVVIIFSMDLASLT